MCDMVEHMEEEETLCPDCHETLNEDDEGNVWCPNHCESV